MPIEDLFSIQAKEAGSLEDLLRSSIRAATLVERAAIVERLKAEARSGSWAEARWPTQEVAAIAVYDKARNVTLTWFGHHTVHADFGNDIRASWPVGDRDFEHAHPLEVLHSMREYLKSFQAVPARDAAPGDDSEVRADRVV